MATLVLGAVGRSFGGPLGGIVGSAIGAVVDRGILGGAGGHADRLGAITVQSAAYGEAIPVISGRMRVAGNLLWTSGIMEAAGGGGKRNGTSTSTYNYTASFAVGLAGRQIADVGRIWADGRLIRGADGVFLSPTVMRLHSGNESQPVDPLIAAAEGLEGTPAYRGIAYAVFEGLPLTDFGNRIPNLTFEVVADAGGSIDAGVAIAALAVAEGRPVATAEGSFPAMTGHFCGSGADIADAVSGLIALSGAAVVAGDALKVVAGVQPPIVLPAADGQARLPGESRNRDRSHRLGGDARVGGVEIGFFDVDRDYQSGVQRAQSDGGGAMTRLAVAGAMSAGQAKTLAQAMLGRARAACLQTTVRLPWRHLGMNPGAQVQLGSDPTLWRVRQAQFESFVVNLDLERMEHSAPAAMTAASGRALAFDDQPAGASIVQLLALPMLPGESGSELRLWIAAAGASPGWRRAAIEISADGGTSYVPVGVIEGGTVMGRASTALEPYGTSESFIEIETLSDRMWLQSLPQASLEVGGNLVLLGDELVQFAFAEALGQRRFRLSGLVRGCRGSIAPASGHRIGERFVLLDRSAMLRVGIADDAIGRRFWARAGGVSDCGVEPVSAMLSFN